MSLSEEINKSNPIFYKPLTEELLEETLNKMIKNIPKSSSFSFYTGYVGNFIFNLCMLGIKSTYGVRWGHTTHNKTRDTWFWFGVKHGPVKGKLNRRTHLIDVYDATQYKFSTKDFKDIENYIKTKTC